MRSQYSTFMMRLLWGAVFLFALPNIFLYSEVWGYEYLQIDSLATLMFFDTISFLIFLVIWNFFERIEINQQLVTVSKGFGLIRYSFLLSDIRNYSLQHIQSRNHEYHELYLYLNNSKMVRFSSSPYCNFNELVPFFIEGKENITRGVKKNRRFVGWTILIAFYGLLIGTAVYGWINFIPEEKTYPVEKIRVVLTEGPNEFGKASNRRISFNTKPYQEFYFIMYNDEYQHTASEELIKDSKVGDSLYLYISQLDYRTKITHSQTPDFYGKHFEWGEIRVYGVENREWVYLQHPDVITHYTSIELFIILNAVFAAVLLFFILLTIFPEMLY